MACAPPIIESATGIITQPLLRSDMSRAALVVGCLTSLNVPSPADAIAMANAWQSAFNGNIATFMDNEVLIERPTVKLGQGTAVPFEATATGATVNGSIAGSYLPPNVALLCKKVTNLGGRQNRGRMYLPFSLQPTDVSENGTIDGTVLAARQAVVSNFLTALETAHYPLYIENKVFDHPVPPRCVVSISKSADPVAFLTCEPIIATQRRRLDR